MLADILWSLDASPENRRRALSLARQALEDYRAASPRESPDAAEVARWIRERSGGRVIAAL